MLTQDDKAELIKRCRHLLARHGGRRAFEEDADDGDGDDHHSYIKYCEVRGHGATLKIVGRFYKTEGFSDTLELRVEDVGRVFRVPLSAAHDRTFNPLADYLWGNRRHGRDALETLRKYMVLDDLSQV